MKSKFGDYAMLNVLADQWKAQGVGSDPRLLMDGVPSKVKICWLLDDRKGGEQDASELEEPHLKLVVMHDFLWALIKEWASDRAHQHQAKNCDSGHDIQPGGAGGSEYLTGCYHLSPQPGEADCVSYVRTRALTWLTSSGR